MARRIKWLMIKTKLNINELYGFFYKNTFNSLSEFGFLNVEINKSEILSTYVEVHTSYQEYINPLGGRHEQRLVSHVVFDFFIESTDKGFFLLSIINPPKSIKKFVDFISSSFNYNVSFSIVNLCLTDVIDRINSCLDVNLLLINKINVSNFKLNDSSIASVEIISKINALREIDIYTKGLSYSIDKIKGSMLFYDKKIIFEISKSSLVVSDDEVKISLLNKIIHG